eukprot:1171981-Amphidinium_carterae.1
MDCCCFMWRQESVLCGVAIIHVDDFLLIHRSDFKQLTEIHSSFNWGSWKTLGASSPGILQFLGKEVHICHDHVLLNQRQFIRDTKVGSHTRRGSPEQTLLDEELTEYSVTATKWRPNQSTAASLAADSLIPLYAQQTEEVGIKFIPVPLHQLILVGYGDASFANTPDKKSQLGLLVVATSADALLPGKVARASVV